MGARVRPSVGLISVLFLLLTASLSDGAVKKTRKRVVCYYTNWSVYRLGLAKYLPANINPYLCTHLIYAFGGFNDDFELEPFDQYQDIEKGGYARFNGMKQYNSGLRTLLALGGWNEGSGRFSELVAEPEYRQRFIVSAIRYLRQYNFDGLDLDWEYPGSRSGSDFGDKQNYATLCEEIREAFEVESLQTNRPALLLTVAVPAGTATIEKGFNIPRLNAAVDFFNILAYDYHSSNEALTDHHAPLFALPGTSSFDFRAELNVDYTVRFYLKSGAERRKLVVGIPTYGRTYTLLDENFNGLHASAKAPGSKGKNTKEDGYLSFYEVCENVAVGNWSVYRPYPDAMGPYATRGTQWVGYDDEFIVKKKALYVRDNKLGGIMFWSIDNDDFRGRCAGRPYPLIEAAKDAYFSPAPGDPPKQAAAPTPVPPATPDPSADFSCKREGFYPHPTECNKYFWCLNGGPLGVIPHSFTCPDGLLFNRGTDSCDFPRNVKCKIEAKEVTSITFPPTKAAITLPSTETNVGDVTPDPFAEFYEDYDTEDLPPLELDSIGGEFDFARPVESARATERAVTSSRPQVLGESRGGSVKAASATASTTSEKPGAAGADPEDLKQLLDIIKQLGGVDGVRALLAGESTKTGTKVPQLSEQQRKTLQTIVDKQENTPSRTRYSSIERTRSTTPAPQLALTTRRSVTSASEQDGPARSSTAAPRVRLTLSRRQRLRGGSRGRTETETSTEAVERSRPAAGSRRQYSSIQRTRSRPEKTDDTKVAVPSSVPSRRQYTTLRRQRPSAPPPADAGAEGATTAEEVVPTEAVRGATVAPEAQNTEEDPAEREDENDAPTSTDISSVQSLLVNSDETANTVEPESNRGRRIRIRLRRPNSSGPRASQTLSTTTEAPPENYVTTVRSRAEEVTEVVAEETTDSPGEDSETADERKLRVIRLKRPRGEPVETVTVLPPGLNDNEVTLASLDLSSSSETSGLASDTKQLSEEAVADTKQLKEQGSPAPETELTQLDSKVTNEVPRIDNQQSLLRNTLKRLESTQTENEAIDDSLDKTDSSASRGFSRRTRLRGGLRGQGPILRARTASTSFTEPTPRAVEAIERGNRRFTLPGSRRLLRGRGRAGSRRIITPAPTQSSAELNTEAAIEDTAEPITEAITGAVTEAVTETGLELTTEPTIEVTTELAIDDSKEALTDDAVESNTLKPIPTQSELQDSDEGDFNVPPTISAIETVDKQVSTDNLRSAIKGSTIDGIETSVEDTSTEVPNTAVGTRVSSIRGRDGTANLTSRLQSEEDDKPEEARSSGSRGLFRRIRPTSGNVLRRRITSGRRQGLLRGRPRQEIIAATTESAADITTENPRGLLSRFRGDAQPETHSGQDVVSTLDEEFTTVSPLSLSISSSERDTFSGLDEEVPTESPLISTTRRDLTLPENSTSSNVTNSTTISSDGAAIATESSPTTEETSTKPSLSEPGTEPSNTSLSATSAIEGERLSTTRFDGAELVGSTTERSASVETTTAESVQDLFHSIFLDAEGATVPTLTDEQILNVNSSLFGAISGQTNSSSPLRTTPEDLFQQVLLQSKIDLADASLNPPAGKTVFDEVRAREEELVRGFEESEEDKETDDDFTVTSPSSALPGLRQTLRNQPTRDESARENRLPLREGLLRRIHSNQQSQDVQDTIRKPELIRGSLFNRRRPIDEAIANSTETSILDDLIEEIIIKDEQIDESRITEQPTDDNTATTTEASAGVESTTFAENNSAAGLSEGSTTILGQEAVEPTIVPVVAWLTGNASTEVSTAEDIANSTESVVTLEFPVSTEFALGIAPDNSTDQEGSTDVGTTESSLETSTQPSDTTEEKLVITTESSTETENESDTDTSTNDDVIRTSTYDEQSKEENVPTLTESTNERPATAFRQRIASGDRRQRPDPFTAGRRRPSPLTRGRNRSQSRPFGLIRDQLPFKESSEEVQQVLSSTTEGSPLEPTTTTPSTSTQEVTSETGKSVDELEPVTEAAGSPELSETEVGENAEVVQETNENASVLRVTRLRGQPNNRLRLPGLSSEPTEDNVEASTGSAQRRRPFPFRPSNAQPGRRLGALFRDRLAATIGAGRPADSEADANGATEAVDVNESSQNSGSKDISIRLPATNPSDADIGESLPEHAEDTLEVTSERTALKRPPILSRNLGSRIRGRFNVQAAESVTGENISQTDGAQLATTERTEESTVASIISDEPESQDYSRTSTVGSPFLAASVVETEIRPGVEPTTRKSVTTLRGGSRGGQRRGSLGSQLRERLAALNGLKADTPGVLSARQVEVDDAPAKPSTEEPTTPETSKSGQDTDEISSKINIANSLSAEPTIRPPSDRRARPRGFTPSGRPRRINGRPLPSQSLEESSKDVEALQKSTAISIDAVQSPTVRNRVQPRPPESISDASEDSSATERTQKSLFPESASESKPPEPKQSLRDRLRAQLQASLARNRGSSVETARPEIDRTTVRPTEFSTTLKAATIPEESTQSSVELTESVTEEVEDGTPSIPITTERVYPSTTTLVTVPQPSTEDYSINDSASTTEALEKATQSQDTNEASITFSAPSSPTTTGRPLSLVEQLRQRQKEKQNSVKSFVEQLRLSLQSNENGEEEKAIEGDATQTTSIASRNSAKATTKAIASTIEGSLAVESSIEATSTSKPSSFHNEDALHGLFSNATDDTTVESLTEGVTEASSITTVPGKSADLTPRRTTARKIADNDLTLLNGYPDEEEENEGSVNTTPPGLVYETTTSKASAEDGIVLASSFEPGTQTSIITTFTTSSSATESVTYAPQVENEKNFPNDMLLEEGVVYAVAEVSATTKSPPESTTELDATTVTSPSTQTSIATTEYDAEVTTTMTPVPEYDTPTLSSTIEDITTTPYPTTEGSNHQAPTTEPAFISTTTPHWFRDARLFRSEAFDTSTGRTVINGEENASTSQDSGSFVAVKVSVSSDHSIDGMTDDITYFTTSESTTPASSDSPLDGLYKLWSSNSQSETATEPASVTESSSEFSTENSERTTAYGNLADRLRESVQQTTTESGISVVHAEGPATASQPATSVVETTTTAPPTLEDGVFIVQATSGENDFAEDENISSEADLAAHEIDRPQEASLVHEFPTRIPETKRNLFDQDGVLAFSTVTPRYRDPDSLFKRKTYIQSGGSHHNAITWMLGLCSVFVLLVNRS